VLRLAFCFLLVAACGVTAARGEITWSGDVDPSDPTTWTSETNAFIGRTSQGALSVEEAAALASSDVVIGADSDSFGEVAVDGAGSAWTISRSLRVGRNGEGLLAIATRLW
jgi:T5SS/PEP-CTERM-associated repeat protein